ncbi:MAG: glycoside hydrolase family 140 protein [Niabella sp.]
MIAVINISLQSSLQAQQLPPVEVSHNKHFFQTSDGKPFFWLGDTGWLLFIKCSREEVLQYLDIRQKQGFNVIQVMVLHTLKAENVYGKSALQNGDITKPLVTPGNSFEDKNAYDFWDHIDFVIEEAAKRGMYIALVPVWGSNVKAGKLTAKQAAVYGEFISKRFKKHSNIIWINGGDIRADEALGFWNTLGATIKKFDPLHLITYHPRGRYSSTDWFQNTSWLDFNMIQSGHRTYAQDTSSNEKHRFGEDNWRYIVHDYHLKPAKPVLDGEPSYENIPHGLHDSLQPRWTTADVRRYAYWSVFAGGAGFTYGENAVMQFHTKGDADANYGVFSNWKESINAPGAGQLHYLKELMTSKAYFERNPAQEIIINNTGKKYNYLLATKGRDYAMVYTYTGNAFEIDAAKLGFKCNRAAWFDPSTGQQNKAAFITKGNVLSFDPPGEPGKGKDWVLILEK